MLFYIFSWIFFHASWTHSHKFHRLFPLSQYDLPTHTSEILSFSDITNPPQTSALPRPSVIIPSEPPATDSTDKTSSKAVPVMNLDQVKKNPEVDYTRYESVPFIFYSQIDLRRTDLI